MRVGEWTSFDHFDGLGPETDRAVLIKLKDPGALARSQGAAGAFAQGIAPAFIETKVYSGLADQLGEALKAKNIDADISVVQPSLWAPAGNGYIAQDLAYVIGGAGIASFFCWLAFRRKK